MAERVLTLDQIRKKEAEMTRRLVQAQEEAEDALEAARRKAQVLIAQAEVNGRSQGEVQQQAIIAAARIQAEAIIAAAHTQAHQIRQLDAAVIETAVSRVVALLIGEEPA